MDSLKDPLKDSCKAFKDSFKGPSWIAWILVPKQDDDGVRVMSPEPSNPAAKANLTREEGRLASVSGC